ncbi:MAG: hypothetical protein AAF515_20665 [Pseudomonadota bacterium]
MTDTQLDNDALERRVAALPKTVQPEVDLWSQIEADIAQTPRSANLALRLSGLAAAAVVAALLIFVPGRDVPVAAEPDWLVPVEAFDTGNVAMASLRVNMHQNIAAALGELSPKARVDALRNLQRINDARNDILQALQQEPDNPFLSQLLIENYASELSLLNQMRGLTQRARQRTLL